jgi:3-methylfumaryl-CoA hydratase
MSAASESWSVEQVLHEWPVQAAQAMLGDDAAALQSTELPTLWHWFYFLPTPARGAIGIDGHLRIAGQSDDEPPPRRMFAAGRVQIEAPLQLGAKAQMSAGIVATRDTVGSSGPLRIVTYEYRYTQAGRSCIVEQRDIVYRGGDKLTAGAARATAAGPSATSRGQRRVVTPDPVMLMRMSALTFNSHRIHYDQYYAQQVEGYAERLVHAPLTALLLAEHLRATGAQARRFEFKARSPLLVNEPLELLLAPGTSPLALRANGPGGRLAMEATAWI